MGVMSPLSVLMLNAFEVLPQKSEAQSVIMLRLALLIGLFFTAFCLLKYWQAFIHYFPTFMTIGSSLFFTHEHLAICSKAVFSVPEL